MSTQISADWKLVEETANSKELHQGGEAISSVWFKEVRGWNKSNMRFWIVRLNSNDSRLRDVTAAALFGETARFWAGPCWFRREISWVNKAGPAEDEVTSLLLSFCLKVSRRAELWRLLFSSWAARTWLTTADRSETKQSSSCFTPIKRVLDSYLHLCCTLTFTLMDTSEYS